MNPHTITERFHTIIIGGGQAGLAMGYELARRKFSFVILDASEKVGDAWRNRWDSLRLFSPARYVNLPGMQYPGPGDAFPTKDEIADYLRDYARHFRLPVRNGMKVTRLSRKNGRFLVQAGGQQFESENVVVAMANFQQPRIPAFAADLSPQILQLHSHDYRNPSQLRKGNVLVVGSGNSGADIAIELAASHHTFISGKETGHIPWRIESAFVRYFVIRVIRFLGHHILSTATPVGRRARPKLLSKATPLIRVKPQDLVAAGAERVPKVAGETRGKPLLEDGRILDVQNIIWCTGYQPGFSWIDLPVFDDAGKPRHERGIVPHVPGMYFVGLHFLHSMTSATVTGVARDAEYVANSIAARAGEVRAA